MKRNKQINDGYVQAKLITLKNQCESPIEEKVCEAIMELQQNLSKYGIALRFEPQHSIDIELDNRNEEWCAELQGGFCKEHRCFGWKNESLYGFGFGGHCKFLIDFEKYRLDFAIFVENKSIDLECDGETYHSTKNAIMGDRERDEYMIYEGWEVIRIKGFDIMSNNVSKIKNMLLSEIQKVCPKLKEKLNQTYGFSFQTTLRSFNDPKAEPKSSAGME